MNPREVVMLELEMRLNLLSRWCSQGKITPKEHMAMSKTEFEKANRMWRELKREEENLPYAIS